MSVRTPCNEFNPYTTACRDLPALDFVLTPQESTGADMARLHLEAHRRRLNERDTRRANAEVANLLERALEEGA